MTPTCKTSIVVTATTFTLFKANTQRWRPLAATTKEVARPYGRATSFVVSFVLALNRVNIVAVNAILVLHVGKTGRRTVGRTPLGLHVPSPSGLHEKRLRA